jgi:beta-1,4-mannosyl-glycoprotein beta-1,4-N-acetylglucosaminyltransferase
MANCIVFEDGKLIKSYDGDLWNGLFSIVKSNGKLIEYIQSILPNNSLLIIPKSDGNITMVTMDSKYRHDVNWELQIKPYIDYAKEKNKIFMIGTLAQNREENCNYVYLPLDDNFFCNGVTTYFKKELLPKWEERSADLCWRGGCSGVGALESTRVRFVKAIYDYNPNTNVRLSWWWSKNKNIPNEYFAARIDYNEFTKYKIFFIVDGNCIASNHMYGFATGCVPFMISNAKCWFSHLIKPYEHYIHINHDLSNLIEQIEWVKNNDEQAKQIAENAYKFAETYFSSEYQKKYLKETIEKYSISYNRRKIIDCFTFYNELDLLNYRLTILNDYVDYFILVEGNYTHAGNKKQLYYDENKYIFKRFEHKIIHIIVDLPYIYPNINYSNNEQWINENFQRNSINEGIKKLNLQKSDLIIISDLDEIINPNILLNLKNGIIDINNGGYSLLQDFYYYNLNTKHQDLWRLNKIVTYEKYLTSTPQDIRMNNDLPCLENGGWHLSYFGNKDFIKNKLKEFSHQELNNSYYTNDKYIDDKINNNEDLFNRNYVPIKYIKINENDNLPPLYNKYLLNYVENNDLNINVPIYIYFHICCINNWKQIFSNLMFKIKNSGLYNIITEIRCVILGEYDNSINDEKINILFQSPNIELYEKITINHLFNDCINNKDEFYVLYIHTKGVGGRCEKNVYDWVEYLSYFNIYNFNTCLNELSNYSAIGVNLISGDYPLHFSGNFWWSKSSHICKLQLINDNFYNSPEFWITSINENYKSLWNSNTHHYNEPYPPYLYENKLT